MPVKEEPVTLFQGYAIVRITETDAQGRLLLETYGLRHGANCIIAEFAGMADAIRELNRMLAPLTGLPLSLTRDS